MTETDTLTPAEIEAAKEGLDEISRVMIDSMLMRRIHPKHIAEAIKRLDPMYVSPAFVESVERSHFRTMSDTGAHSTALLVWGRVRAAAGMDVLTQGGLVQRTVDGYYADAQRAEDAGDHERSDRARGIARKIAQENQGALERERERVEALHASAATSGVPA